MADTTNPRIKTAGGAWGPQRVALGLSLRALAKASGVSHVTLALAEQGRLIPTGEEYQKVMRALDDLKTGDAA